LGYVREPLAATLFFPLTERDFTYRRYREFLENLDDGRIQTSTLAELEATSRERPLLALRHDIDDRLDSALEIGRLEYEQGIRTTFFVLHTAAYYHDRRRVIEGLKRLQNDWGHEIGFHNDLVTLQCVDRVDAVAYLREQLAWLRGEGLRIVGVAAHGSPHCHRLGYHNSYLFEHAPPIGEFPHRDVVPMRDGPCSIPKIQLGDVGFQYDAYALSYDRYFSDSSFDDRGRRWHPASLDLAHLEQGERVVALLHPCHWDAGSGDKWRRLATRVSRRARHALV
jgi:hypothetical protein